jgi:NADPH:quinone reductase-like Zn-dependent oxidoreductase
MGNQKIAVFDILNGVADFAVTTAPILEPGPDEMRFKVAAFALNQADLLLTQGRHYANAELPIRLGYEGCGTVDAIGAGVTRFQVGDRVTCIPNVDGPYWTAGEYALAKEGFLTAWPDGWSAAQATSLWMQYLTPYFPFAELFPFRPDEWVMITAASGGTGLGSIAMAKLLGARVIATTRSPHKAAALEAHGADIVLSTERDDFVAEVMRVTNNLGVRLICDTLCGPYVPMLTETMADKGIMFIHGALAGDNNFTLSALNLVYRRGGLYGYSLINQLRDPGAIERGTSFIKDALARHALPLPVIDGIFSLDEVRTAYGRMQGGRQIGKIIVSMEPSKSTLPVSG